MAWRQQGSTGSNNIPLGNKRRFVAGDSASPPHNDNGYHPSAPSNGNSDGGFKRGRSPVRGKSLSFCMRTNILTISLEEPNADGTRRRKKRNRWGDATENKAAGLMGLPTAIMANMTSEQLEAYTLHLRIEEISQKLRIDDVVPADGDRYVAQPPASRMTEADHGTDLLLLPHNTTTSVAVSILENTDTESASKTSATS